MIRASSFFKTDFSGARRNACGCTVTRVARTMSASHLPQAHPYNAHERLLENAAADRWLWRSRWAMRGRLNGPNTTADGEVER